MRKIHLQLTLGAMVFCVFILWLAPSAFAVRCTMGSCEEVDRYYDIVPICRDYGTFPPRWWNGYECTYDDVYYDCDGPDCVDGTIIVVENPCKMFPWCHPVTAINYCNTQGTDYWVTIAYRQAEIHDPISCDETKCFYGNCSLYPIPECETNKARCPQQ